MRALLDSRQCMRCNGSRVNIGVEISTREVPEEMHGGICCNNQFAEPVLVTSVNLIDSILSKPESDNLSSSQNAGLSLEFQL